jgi:alpha-mannosidase
MNKSEKSSLSRRDFLGAGILGGAGAVLVLPALGDLAFAADAQKDKGFCLAVCNHWSYIGIGWQLGLESCVLALKDAMEIADRPPHIPSSLDMDAHAFEVMAEKFPETVARFRKYLADGRVELIGGTFSQPMGTAWSGESNIRQIVMARAIIRKVFGYEMQTFLDEEEFSHPQLPQILALAGFRYASLAQWDTCGRTGVPLMDVNVINWQSPDGTSIPASTRTALVTAPQWIQGTVNSPVIKKLQAVGKPLMVCWDEMGWDSGEAPAYLHEAKQYRDLAARLPIEFVTCTGYMDKYGQKPEKTVCLKMDDWAKSLHWGIGGDQITIMNRKLEGLLLAAERFDAVTAALGAKSQAETLEKAWKNMLAAQSHDVGLLEYSRWQSFRMAPYGRFEDRHNFAWGVMGYEHLDKSQEEGRAVMAAVAGELARQINSADGKQGPQAVTVLNPSGWERTDGVLTGRIYPMPEKTVGVIVRDRSGRVVPSQVAVPDKTPDPDTAVASLIFVADKLPAVGYDTYYLDFSEQPLPAATTALRCDEAALTLENEYVKVRLSPTTGAIVSLIHKPTGRETLAGDKCAYPKFTGTPNQNYFANIGGRPPAFYDSSKSKAAIDWLEKGPVRAVVRAQHVWPAMRFETRISLTAGVPYVDVVTRLLDAVPPRSDTSNGCAPGIVPENIKEGYWLSLVPAFTPTSLIRDFPLAVQPTQQSVFEALTFLDMAAKDRGLLMMHTGNQFFRFENGILSNLIMREWESCFSGTHGWPIYVEYRHALMPHAGNLTNADRLRTAATLTQPLLAHVGPPNAGSLPPTKGFVTVSPPAVELSAFRRTLDGKSELRLLEVEGRRSTTTVEFGLPVTTACETNLLGNKVADVARQGSQLRFHTDPWKIRNFEITF